MKQFFMLITLSTSILKYIKTVSWRVKSDGVEDKSVAAVLFFQNFYFNVNKSSVYLKTGTICISIDSPDHTICEWEKTEINSCKSVNSGVACF